jgi:hypothetical protein
VSDRASPLDVFNDATLHSASALHVLGEEIDAEGNPFRPVYRQSVLGYALDDVLERLALPMPNHLKLDADGTEMDVLGGGRRILAEPEVRTLMVEVSTFRTAVEAMIAYLQPLGWPAVERHDRRDAEGQALNTSYIRYER